MANKTKMIIITSDEDVIRQVSMNQNSATQIIDLDQMQKNPFSPTNNSFFMDLAMLANLPQSNSNNDQLVKRSLQSSDSNSSKPNKSLKKSFEMICLICGDQAIGYNYSVLSCGSCKAFFRRNAHHDPAKLQCLIGENQCRIEYAMPRKCQKCRLERCLAEGMKKEFLMTEEQKQKRQKRLENIRNLTSEQLSTVQTTELSTVTNVDSPAPIIEDIDPLIMDFAETDETLQFDGIEDLLFGTLSIEDWATIENLKSSFISLFQIPDMTCSSTRFPRDRFSAFLNWSAFSNQLGMRFIDFFRRINEFEQLPLDDRVILTKYNLFPVFPLFRCFTHEDAQPFVPPYLSESVQQHRNFFLKNGIPMNILDPVVTIISSLIQTTQKDPALLSLLALILFFTPGLALSDDEPILTDPLSVYQIQSSYTKVLWNYLVNQSGELEACRCFLRLTLLLSTIQKTAKNLRMFFRNQCTSLNAAEQIAPLMQSVLNIS